MKNGDFHQESVFSCCFCGVNVLKGNIFFVVSIGRWGSMGVSERIPSGNRGNGNPLVIRGSSHYVKRCSIATLDYQGYFLKKMYMPNMPMVQHD